MIIKGIEITYIAYDSKGARIFMKTAPTTTTYTPIQVDLSIADAAGVYIVQVTNGSGRIIGARRIVVHHP